MKNFCCLKAVFTFLTVFLLSFNLLSARKVLEEGPIDIKSRILHVPSLAELKTVLSTDLSKYYAEVSVEITDCPDLKKAPFHLAASGLGGSPIIVDVGGPGKRPPPNSMVMPPSGQRGQLYSIDNISSRAGFGRKRFVIGAAQGPWDYLNRSSEVVVNLVLNSPASYPGTYAAIRDEKKNKYYVEQLPGNETGICLVGNLFVSEGKPGKVLQVHVKRRTGSSSAFPDIMQKALATHYPKKLVGMGGTFITKRGKLSVHLLPSSLDENLRFIFYNMTAPLVAAGTFVSDITDLSLAPYHFHTFSKHDDGGHYHNDVSPDDIEYLGYFSSGEMIWKVNPGNAEVSGGHGVEI